MNRFNQKFRLKNKYYSIKINYFVLIKKYLAIKRILELQGHKKYKLKIKN